MYLTRQRLETLVPPPTLLQALDDDRDGIEDAGRFDAVADLVAEEIHGLIAPRYRPPLREPVPGIVTRAAAVFAAEMIFQRRLHASDDRNPFAAQARELRRRLEAIGQGNADLYAPDAPSQAHGAVIAEPALTFGGPMV